MSALINIAIGQQGFEKVRDRLGVILLLELTNQKTLQGFDEEIKIYRERLLPMNEADNFYLNVLLDNASYSGKTPTDSQGFTIYNIDCYTTGLSDDNIDGNLDAAVRCHKFLGMCRYILDSTFYKTLGFAPGLIAGVAVQSIELVAQPIHGEDGSYTRFGRLTLGVRIQENQALWDGVTIVGQDTKVHIGESSRGYLYQFTE